MSTKEKILKVGVKLWPDITFQAIGDEIGISRQAVQQHFPQGDLKDTIAEHAVKIGNSRVIVQLIVLNHPAATNMSLADRTKHLSTI